MNIKSNEKKENSTIELVIEVSAAEFEAAINKVYNKQKKNINIPGFRKGKAPRKIIEAMFGAEVFYEEAVEEAYPVAYSEALKETGIDPVAYPKLEIVEMSKDGFTFKALITVKPEAKVKKYKGLSAAKPAVKVTEKDIDGEMKPFIDRASRLVSVTRKAKKGDTAVIDFEGFKDGVAFEGGKGEKYSLELGSGSFVPGFEEQVIGMKAGEEKELDITFPEEYTPELAGAAVVFKVKVHEVKERQTPALDDEFAKDVSEFETLADFRKDLGEKLAQRRETQSQQDYENALMDQLVANLEAEIPDEMVQYQADRMLEDYARRIESQGIPFDQYLSMMGLTADALRLQATEGAQRQVKFDLALGAVAEAEKIEITEEDINAEFETLANEYGMEIEHVKSAVPVEDLKHDMLLKRARQVVIDNGKVGKAAAKKTTAKKEESAEEAPAEEKPKKTTAKKSTAKKAEPAAEGEEKPKKTTTKKTAKTEE